MKLHNADIVRQAIASFQQLHKRRSELQAEIDEIDNALQEIAGKSTSIRQPSTVNAAPAGRRGNTGGNLMPLREAVAQVLKRGPLDRREILKAVQEAGYKFNSTDPLNSLQTFLYGSGKSLVKRVDGKFALASVTSPENVAKATAAAPAEKAKRVMSPAARKKIAEAAKARWAKAKSARK